MDFLPAIAVLIGSAVSTICAFRMEEKSRLTTGVLVGAFIAIGGGFWGSCEQSKFEREQRGRIEDVLGSITGGDSSPVLMTSIEDKILTILTSNLGQFPLYDVVVKVRILRDRHAFEVSPREAFEGATESTLSLGNLVPYSWQELVRFPVPVSGPMRIDFVVMARNGTWRHFVTTRKVEKKWLTAQKSMKVNLENPPPDWKAPAESVPADFPRRPDGQPDW